MGKMRDRYIRLTERGEYELGRSDWRAGLHSNGLEGEAKAAYDLGRCDEQIETILRVEGDAN